MPRSITDPNLTREEKNEILIENHEKIARRERKAINTTLERQYTVLDKVYAAVYYSMKKNAKSDGAGLLTDEQRFEKGLMPVGTDDDEEAEIENEAHDNAIRSIIKTQTLEDYRKFFNTIGLVNAKADHERGEEHAKIKSGLPDTYDEETKNQLADYLVYESMSHANMVQRNIDMMKHTMNNISLDPDDPDPTRTGTDNKSVMNRLLQQECKEKLLDNGRYKEITIGEYMDLLNMNDAQRKALVSQLTTGKGQEKRVPNLNDKLVDRWAEKMNADPYFREEFGKRKKNPEAQKQFADDYQKRVISEHYMNNMPTGWMNEAAKKYENALPEDEKKVYKKGEKFNVNNALKASKLTDPLNEKKIDYEKLKNDLQRENILKNYDLAQEKLKSKAPINAREQYGLSEAYATSREGLQDRSAIMRGAIAKMESTGSKWKYHSKNSSGYNKMLQSMRDYQEALARNEGGKAANIRNTMVKRMTDYITGKESVRSEINGQTRFNTVMAILQREMKPEEFQKVVNKVNAGRKPEQRVQADYYKNIGLQMKADAKDLALDKQMNSFSKATDYAEKYEGTIKKMQTRYGYKEGEDGLDKEYPAIKESGAFDEGFKLSNRDYTALSYSASLNAPKRFTVLREDSILEQQPQVVEVGKKATDLALEAYGKGERKPLGSLIAVGLKRINMDAEKKSREELACMKEMGQRLINMLDRDPELKKYAERSGLTNDEIKKTQELTGPEVKKEKGQALKEDRILG